jgi:hypothetical protein
MVMHDLTRLVASYQGLGPRLSDPGKADPMEKPHSSGAFPFPHHVDADQNSTITPTLGSTVVPTFSTSLVW